MKPLGWVLAAGLLILVGYCAGSDVSDTERENWRREARHAIAKKNVVIDSLIEDGRIHKRRGDSLETVARSLFANAEQQPDTVALPDTTASDSVRYWRSKYERERSRSEDYRAAYLSQMEATAEQRVRAESAEAARDSSQADVKRLKKLLSDGVELSEQSECKIVGLLPCPSRGVTGALLFVGGVVVGVQVAR